MRLDGFRPEFLDFDKGIRVGHLDPHERITQILKLSLEAKYGQPFLVDRWGRGVYWQWICFVPKANRQAKPLSANVNFGCSKFFIMVDREEALFKAGLQIERGFLETDRYPDCRLREDWDWHRLISCFQDGHGLIKQLRRLAGEGFRLQAGAWETPSNYDRDHFPSRTRLLNVLREIRPDVWGGFQLYYPMTAEEVRVSSGQDLVESMLAVFEEVRPVMNHCMQVPVQSA